MLLSWLRSYKFIKSLLVHFELVFFIILFVADVSTDFLPFYTRRVRCLVVTFLYRRSLTSLFFTYYVSLFLNF